MKGKEAFRGRLLFRTSYRDLSPSYWTLCQSKRFDAPESLNSPNFLEDSFEFLWTKHNQLLVEFYSVRRAMRLESQNFPQ